MNPNKALWEKGDFIRIAQSMRESAFVRDARAPAAASSGGSSAGSNAPSGRRRPVTSAASSS
jgi:hypothetical protein